MSRVAAAPELAAVLALFFAVIRAFVVGVSLQVPPRQFRLRSIAAPSAMDISLAVGFVFLVLLGFVLRVGRVFFFLLC